MVDDNINNYMFQFIKDVCDEIGPRESGTEQEILAGNKIEEEMRNFCDTTHQEEYISSPHAFLGGIKYGALLALISIMLYWFSLLVDLTLLPIPMFYSFIFISIALILISITISYFITEVMKYHEFFDFLFPKKMSKNIIGTIDPKNSVKNTIIFSAHHDSAFEFNTFYYFKRFGQYIINFGYFGVAVLFLAVIIKLVFQSLSIEFDLLFLGFGIFFLFFIPIALAYVFFHSYRPVLGAFDNLSGVSIVLGMAAIAGVDDVFAVTLGGVESVEGIEHRIFRGFPHRSPFPAKNRAFWFKRTRDSGIGPVRLLKERSMVEFSGTSLANLGGIAPEILL